MHNLRPQGYMRTFDTFGRVIERDTHTCKHCARVFEIEPRADPNEFWCNCCMAPICKHCAGKPCVPYMKRMDLAEKRDLATRQLRLDMGWL